MYSLSVEEAEILFSAESLASYFVDAREEEQQVRPLGTGGYPGKYPGNRVQGTETGTRV